MSQELRLSTPPRDGYDVYYAEKLWSWVPEMYRTLDALPPANGALRALVEIVAQEAAILRRDIDRLWDDQAIELCDDWAVAYLGALVGAKPLSRADPRGSRLAAARAIAYQRRKGTLTVIGMAIRDIGGVEGVGVEAFRRLARFPHRLDSDAIARGAVTRSPGGGFARMTSPRISGLIDTAFDEFAHFPDPRRLRGPLGRYGLRKCNLHLYALLSQPIDLPTPQRIGPNRYTLDPSGREVPLFQRGQASDRPPDAIRETDLPLPILCRRFNATAHRITAEALALINDPGLDVALAPLLGIRFDSGAVFRRLVASRLTAGQITTFMGRLLDVTLLPEAPKALLWEDSLALVNDTEHTLSPLPPSAVCSASLTDWQAGLTLDPYIALAIDPDSGRMVRGAAITANPVFTTRLHLGYFDAIGAIGLRHEPQKLPTPNLVVSPGATGPNAGFTNPGPVGMTFPAPLVGVTRFTTSRTYRPILPAGRNFSGITQARLDAEQGARPFVRFLADSATLDITFTAAPAVAGQTRSLIIDGLWIGLLASTVVPEVLADAGDAATPILSRIILDGDFDEVIIRNATLDPGGERARSTPLSAVAIPIVRLEIEGQVDRLLIERSIVGPIWETNNNPALCSPGSIEIFDSIVQSIDPAMNAIQTRLSRLRLVRSTVFGGVEVARLNATDSIIVGRTRVTDSQHGCFRYSATNKQGAVLPPQFESFVPDSGLPVDWFQSRRFGDPDFAVLSAIAPEALSAGGENGAEMGAFNARALTVARADLATMVRDLLPVGQTPQFILAQPAFRKGSQ
ncbi:hypothetical protein [Sphingomonas sp.]|uniref:hypothetical protein n=1 Tax=Sphingomonas sp. TaxID=28214 RepID=UPI003D6D9D34